MQSLKMTDGLGHLLIMMMYIKYAETYNNRTLITTSQLRNSTETSESEDNISAHEISLEELCILFKTPKNECSCDLFKGYCPEKKKQVIHQLTCSITTDIIEASVRLISALIGIIGNGLVIFVMFKLRKNLSQFKKIIFYLSFSDLLYSMSNLVLAVALYRTCKWDLGRTGCKLFRGFGYTSSVIALGFIVMVAIERYYGIVKVFHESFIKRRFCLILLVNLIFAIATAVPIMIYSDIDKFGTCKEIWNTADGSLIYSWFVLVGTFILPVAAISWLYYHCVKVMEERVKNMYFYNGSNKTSNIKSNKKMMRLLIAVLLAFCLLVGPNKIIWIVNSYTDFTKMDTVTFRVVKYLSLFPYMFHVSVNPLIYSITDKTFREVIFKTTKKSTTVYSGTSQETQPATSNYTKQPSASSDNMELIVCTR